MTERNIAEIKISEFVAKMKADKKELEENRSPSEEIDKLAVEVVSAQSEKGLKIENNKEAITELGDAIPVHNNHSRKETKKSEETDERNI